MSRNLAEAYPDIAKQWSARNQDITPSDVSSGSNKKIWWKGDCGHEWDAIIKNRVRGSGCPYCSGNKLLKGFNDLANSKPELAGEWSDKNFPLRPDMVMRKSNKEVWWRCREYGHEWKARVADRYEGHGCPYCSNEKLLKGFNDLESRYPYIAREWSDRNLPLKACDVFPATLVRPWWKCSKCGYEWQVTLYKRIEGAGCLECARKRRNDTVAKNREERERRRIEEKRLAEMRTGDYMLRKYVGDAGLTLFHNYDEIIGIPLEYYIKEKNAAIVFNRPHYNNNTGHRHEWVKNHLCHKAGIKLIRIMDNNEREFRDCINIVKLDDSYEALKEAVEYAMELLGIRMDSTV